MGRRTVDKITEWTEVGEDGMKIVRVSYTWKLSGVPSWLDKSAFAGVEGMSEPVENVIALVKTSNGWEAN